MSRAIKFPQKPYKPQYGRIHPLVATAAVSVTLVSLVGVAAITGVLPSSNSTTATAASPSGLNSSVTARQAAPSPQTPTYVAIPDPEPAPRQVSPDRYAQPYRQVEYREAKPPAVCNSCGRVESVVAVKQPAHGTGLGVAAGAVLGGVLGNQVGGGNGRTLATVAGAVAGGYGGNEVEKHARSTTTYRVRVHMDNGETRTFPQNGPGGFRVGDRVKIVNGALVLR